MEFELEAKHTDIKDLAEQITGQFDSLKLVKNFSCTFDGHEISFHMSDRRNRMLDKSISGDSHFVGQSLDFKDDIEPFVREKSELFVGKIAGLQKGFNEIERQIVEADLEQRRQEE